MRNLTRWLGLLGISSVAMIWQMMRMRAHGPSQITKSSLLRQTGGHEAPHFTSTVDPRRKGFCGFVDLVAAEVHNRSSFELHVERHLTTRWSTPMHPGGLDLPPFAGVSQAGIHILIAAFAHCRPLCFSSASARAPPRPRPRHRPGLPSWTAHRQYRFVGFGSRGPPTTRWKKKKKLKKNSLEPGIDNIL